LPPREGSIPAAKSFCCTGAAEADKLVEGAATATVKLPVTAVVPVTLIAKGFGEQVTPAGKPVAGQVTFTLLMNPPVGVTVIVEVPLLPAVAVTALPPTVNDPVLVTVMVVAGALEVA